MSKKIQTLNSQEVLDEVHAETAKEMAERLQKEVDEFYSAIGFNLLEGYGNDNPGANAHVR